MYRYHRLGLGKQRGNERHFSYFSLRSLVSLPKKGINTSLARKITYRLKRLFSTSGATIKNVKLVSGSISFFQNEFIHCSSTTFLATLPNYQYYHLSIETIKYYPLSSYKSFWPITKDSTNPFNQWKLQTNEADAKRGKMLEPITIAYGFSWQSGASLLGKQIRH